MSDSESDYSSDSDESTASESDQPIVRYQALFRSLRGAHSPVDNAADPHTQLTYLRSPRYHLSLPPKLLAHVLSNFSRHDASQLPPRDWARNNGTLFSASLVSKAWGTAAHPFLYTADMHISWRTSSSTKLVRTFRGHPSLCLRVRTLVVHYTTYEDWSEEWKNTSEGRRAERVARRKWPRVIDSDGDSESDDEGQLDSFVWTAMEASRVFKGNDS